MRMTLLALLLAASWANSVAYAKSSKIQVTYAQPNNKIETTNLDLLKKSDVIQGFTEVVDSEFKLKYPIKVQFGANDGPLYDPET
ncbi:MAG TPA: hypothetical protein PLM98_13585, partial [Thiolinea sp.]|nr:hypothetical protein [Thiolinea sp.]